MEIIDYSLLTPPDLEEEIAKTIVIDFFYIFMGGNLKI
jgi:hypothetical protein